MNFDDDLSYSLINTEFNDISNESNDAYTAINFYEKDELKLYEECKKFIIQTQMASTSSLQRKFNIGYNLSARIIDNLEKEGVIGPQIRALPREVLWKEYYISNYQYDYDINIFKDKVITSSNRYINIFYNTIKTKGYVDKEYFMDLLSLNEYQYDHTIEELLTNNVIVMSDGKYILSNISVNYDFVYKQDDVYDTFSKIYDSNIYKEYEKISNGLEFEVFLSTLLNKIGYKSYITQKSNDFGADIIAEKDNIKYAIQCKFYSSPIGVSAIQEVLGGKEYYNCNIGIVATNSSFTRQAIELSSKSNVVLWDGNYIIENFMTSE
ncbi:restriction endonuclease [Candidatus Stoquefichus sp. SB1]|uniref:restriction endonuclease n=1 Tax=Candidatus Stoquefichus sp. SB1 TaxID=1658109 RepID=UPI001E4D7F04|nr:restriction endonuclease [Candidatus Stoquefichus sp. SB1]